MKEQDPDLRERGLQIIGHHCKGREENTRLAFRKLRYLVEWNLQWKVFYVTNVYVSGIMFISCVGECVDKQLTSNCEKWEGQGLCMTSGGWKEYMEEHCAKTCLFCESSGK